MPDPTLLLAENNTGTLVNQLHELEAKFNLIAANGHDGAEKVVDSGIVDAGVFDIRLKHDWDATDHSGLELARRAAALQMQTVIFSPEENFIAARAALNWPPEPPPPNVHFVAKQNGGGVQKLVRTLETEIKPVLETAASEDRIRARTRSATPPSGGTSQLRLVLPVVLLVLTLITAGAALLFGQFFLLLVTLALAVITAVLMITSLNNGV